MNIVWFTWKDSENPLAGGAEVVNEELGARLAQAGHAVTFLTSGFPGATASTSRRGFTVIRTGGRFTNYLTARTYFLKHVSSLSPDLVIDECNTMPYFVGTYTGARTVLFFHMLCRQIWFYELPQPLSTLGYLLEPLYLRLLKPKSTVITISESTRRDLIANGYSPKNIHVISEGITLAPLRSLSDGHKFEQPTLLIHGSIRAMKRTLDGVKAFEMAKAKVPGLRLIISGDGSGSYGQKVLSYVKASPHAQSIRYVGRVSEDTKIKLMRQSHVIMVTSVKEGWGLIVTEAASQGTPAVVYNSDGLRDSVQAGVTGIITPANTPAALAQCVRELLADTSEYERLRLAGWQWAQTLTFDRSYADFTRAIGLD